MPTIGETLRQARMRQHLDIADVESRTKIRAKYLRALENEEFGLLPGSTFVRTFLRTYAEVLGLDPHRLVEEYRTNYEPRDELDLQPLGGAPAAAGARERPGRPRRPGRPSPLAITAGGIVVVLLFLIVLGLTGGNENDKGSSQSARTRTEENRSKAQKKKRKKKAAPAPAIVSLRVAPDGPTYVCLDRGPGTPKLFEGTISQPQTFKGRKLRILLGRTAGALTVNGKRFPVQPSATPVGYEFSRTGSKAIPPRQRPCVA